MFLFVDEDVVVVVVYDGLTDGASNRNRSTADAGGMSSFPILVGGDEVGGFHGRYDFGFFLLIVFLPVGLTDGVSDRN